MKNPHNVTESYRFLAQSSLRPRDKSSGGTAGLYFYVHIPIGVWDGRDAILLLQVQFTIALLMGHHKDHENGGDTEIYKW